MEEERLRKIEERLGRMAPTFQPGGGGPNPVPPVQVYDDLLELVAEVRRLREKEGELLRVLRQFHEYMGYSNADEHLSEDGYEYFGRVGEVGEGKRPPETVGDWES